MHACLHGMQIINVCMESNTEKWGESRCHGCPNLLTWTKTYRCFPFSCFRSLWDNESGADFPLPQSLLDSSSERLLKQIVNRLGRGTTRPQMRRWKQSAHAWRLAFLRWVVDGHCADCMDPRTDVQYGAVGHCSKKYLRSIRCAFPRSLIRLSLLKTCILLGVIKKKSIPALGLRDRIDLYHLLDESTILRITVETELDHRGTFHYWLGL